MLWLAVHHQQKQALELFSMEIASAGTSMGQYKMNGSNNKVYLARFLTLANSQIKAKPTERV